MEIDGRLRQMAPAAREGVVGVLAAELAADERVAFAYLHGSFLVEAAFHDVDVAVELAAGHDRAEEAESLATCLSDRVRLPVDVRVLNGAPVAFVYHALRGRLLACRDDDALTVRMEDVVRRYLDEAPLLRRAAQEAFAA